ncbi:PREDICTED: cytokine receptor common subunit beta [Tinamus guttatus]|uniref:cytokine receptor common subunit beta n=1 Tax=Tinamus guttatus TaxID=94827 RepID=UPI00052EC872|nr:PREDICTED: cytokine receptor common subunit beta [Tinamus guttatus]
MKKICSLLLSLPFFFSAQAIRESVPMQNLSCYNDYNSQVTCTWMEHSEAHVFLGMTLYRRDGNKKKNEEMHCKPQAENEFHKVPKFYIHWICHSTVDSTFGIGVDDIYSFKPNKTLQAELNVHLYKIVQPLPPQNLSVSLMTSGDFLLTWKGYEGNPGLSNALEYEVAYKQKWESWENLQTIDIVNDEPPFIFTLQMLESSTKYRGRMRTRVNSDGYHGPWSEWSEEFTWETENILSPVVLPVMLPAIIIALIIVAHCSYKYFLRKKKNWEESIPNPSKSLLIQSYLQKVHLGNWLTNSQVDFNKHSFSEKMDQASFLQVEDRQKNTLTESSEWQAEKAEVSLIALDPQNLYRALDVPDHVPADCPSNEMAYPSFPFSRENSADASITSQTAFTRFDFNGPDLYSPMISSQPDMHQALQAVPAGLHGKSGSLQYVILPKEACPQAPQRQAQPGVLPLQPSMLPHQKEMTQHLSNGEEISPAQPDHGECTHVGAEGQESPVALSCTGSPQQCSLDYITTDGLLLPSAQDSNHLALTADAELASDPQEIQRPEDCSCSEFSPGKSGVVVAVSAPTPNPSPELHLDAFGDYLTVPPCPHGTSESTNISLPVLPKGNNFPKEQSLSGSNLVVLNPDSTEPVFLCEIGDYCFPSLKHSEKMCISQEDPQVKKPEGRTSPGKLVSDDVSISGREQNVKKMQAIRLFKSLKSDDYFPWQQSSRVTEIH